MTIGLRGKCGIALCLFIGCQREGEHKRVEAGVEHAASDREAGGTGLDTTSVQLMITGTRYTAPPSQTMSDADQSAIRIVFTSEVDSANAALSTFAGTMLLTDPQERQTGDGATGQSFQEIPRASYYDDVIGDATEEDENAGAAWKIIEVASPESGRYNLSIQGTSDGIYSLSVTEHRGNQPTLSWELKDIPIRVGAKHDFAFDFGESIDPRSWFRGGYDGGGAEPSFVNRMLSYANITHERVIIPSNAKSAALLIVYAEGINPATFRASLDGLDFSHAFSPASGMAEMVSIPVHPGDNVLILSVEGVAQNTAGKDVNKIVFHMVAAPPR